MSRKFVKHPTKIQASKNYGGAFDIDPEMFFTRDDLDEMTEVVVNHVQESVPGTCYLSDAWIGGPSNQTVHVEVDWSETGSTYTAEVDVDMRKIKKPSDLRHKYALTIAGIIIEKMRADAESYELNGVGVEGSLNISSTREELEKEISDAVIQTMQSPEFGFTAEEAEQYSRVTLQDMEDNVRVEVGVEVDFDGMMQISEVLDSIVSKIDPNAYFDFDDSGIMSAYINSEYIQ